MNILVYVDSMSPAGGIERVVSKHISFFSKKYNITLLTKDSLESFYDLPQNIKIESLEISDKYNMRSKLQRIYQTLKQLFVARKKLKEYQYEYDLVYCTHVRNLLELYLAGFNLKNVLLTEHGSYYGYNRVYKKLKQFLYPKCKYIISPTSMDYEIYQTQKCNTFYIPNPLSFYNENFADLNSKIIVNIGRLTSDKRQDLLLEIWNIVSRNHPDWKLKIVGKGECKDSLMQIIQKYNLAGSVEIIEPIKDIESIFLKSSIFAFTSKYEGFGMVLAEAMSCGVPCISFDIPSGPRDILEHEKDGFLIKEGNVEQYILKLEIMMNNEDKRRDMGKKSRENIKKFLDTDIEEKWISLLEKGNI
jgi:glycosyltransferase involved in cell wall biosynthesis